MDILEFIKKIFIAVPSWCFSIVAVPFILLLISKIENKNIPIYQDDLIIRWPKSNLWFSAILNPLALILIMLALLSNQTAGIVCAILLITIVVFPCLFLMILYCNNRLIMHKDSFTYRTVFRKSYTYRMNDVISIKKIGLGLRVLRFHRKKFLLMNQFLECNIL